MNTVTALSAQDVMGSRNVSLANRAAQEASLLAEQTGKIDPQRDEILLARNDRFWGPPAKPDQILFRRAGAPAALADSTDSPAAIG